MNLKLDNQFNLGSNQFYISMWYITLQVCKHLHLTDNNYLKNILQHLYIGVLITSSIIVLIFLARYSTYHLHQYANLRTFPLVFIQFKTNCTSKHCKNPFLIKIGLKLSNGHESNINPSTFMCWQLISQERKKSGDEQNFIYKNYKLKRN